MADKLRLEKMVTGVIAFIHLIKSFMKHAVLLGMNTHKQKILLSGILNSVCVRAVERSNPFTLFTDTSRLLWVTLSKAYYIKYLAGFSQNRD